MKLIEERASKLELRNKHKVKEKEIAEETRKDELGMHEQNER